MRIFINLGQPEVQIGLIPGAGGTQRLPRLIGLRYALEMITIGKPIKAEVAHQRGLVDEVTDPEKLVDAAVKAAMLDFGMPMGPATLADLTGIDIGYHVGKTFEKRLGERYKVHPLLEAIYQTGCYGRLTAAGFYATRINGGLKTCMIR